MIVIVLFMLILLAGVLAASLQLGLSSRQSTADQASTLRAQYVAESGVAVMKSRLQDIQAILSPTRVNASGQTIQQIVVPFTTTKDSLLIDAQKFCNKLGVLESKAWVAAPEFAVARGDDDKLYPEAKQCMVADGSIPGQFSLLAQYVQPQAFDVLKATERPPNVNDLSSRLNWWATFLSTQQSFGDTRFNVRPLRAVKLTDVKYRFYFGVSDAFARGTVNGATRVLAARRATNGDWWFEIELPSLLDDVLMTNHHRAKPEQNANGSYKNYQSAGAPAVNFTTQIFDGSLHTNEKFLFTSDASAQFKGKVSSVGCIDLPGDGLAPDGNCVQTAGVYVNGALFAPTATLGDTDKDKQIADKITGDGRTVKFVQTATNPPKTDYAQTDFTAAYKPLPTNENDQVAAATSGGLTLSGNQVGVELVAGGENGQPLTTYTPSTKKWTEPNPTYQYIRLLKTQTTQQCTWSGQLYYSDTYNRQTGQYEPDSSWNDTPTDKRYRGNSGGAYRYWRDTQTCRNVTETVVDDQNEYRTTSNGDLFKKNNAGDWISQGRKFNGVIYGATFQTVRGPERIGNGDGKNLANVPPAIASFTGLTLASTNDIVVDSDLTLSETPCRFAEVNATPPCTRQPANILGIYSQNGDVRWSTKTGDNLNIHAAVIASNGQVTTDDYANRRVQGNLNLIGSLIANWYGPFGLTSGVGYGRDFTYDQRLRRGITPPFFPVSPRWNVQAASDVSDKRLDAVVLQQVTAGEY